MDSSDWQDLRAAAKWVLGLIGTAAFGVLYAVSKDPTAFKFGLACVVTAGLLYFYDRRGSR